MFRIGLLNKKSGEAYVCGGTLQEVINFIKENAQEPVVGIGQLFARLNMRDSSQFLDTTTPNGWRVIIMMEDN